jgi:hypothetical protein
MQVEEPAAQGELSEFRQTVQHLLDTKLGQWVLFVGIDLSILRLSRENGYF